MSGVSSPEDSTVALEKAAWDGFMDYPDIAGKMVAAMPLDHRMPRDSGVTGVVGCHGECVTLGPLGFVIEFSEPMKVVRAFDPDVVISNDMVTHRRFYPWGSCVVTWEIARTAIPATTDGEDPAVR